MAEYLCMKCKHNNNGWCKMRKQNGLKKLNIQECKEYKTDGSKLLIERTNKDYYGQQFISIKINNETIELPEKVLQDFIEDKQLKEIEINIPREEM